MLGDMSYQDTEVHRHCAAHDRILVATRRDAYRHHSEGVEVRRSSTASARSPSRPSTPTSRRCSTAAARSPRGLRATRRFALGGVFVYQLVLLYRFERGDDPRAA